MGVDCKECLSVFGWRDFPSLKDYRYTIVVLGVILIVKLDRVSRGDRL